MNLQSILLLKLSRSTPFASHSRQGNSVDNPRCHFCQCELLNFLTRIRRLRVDTVARIHRPLEQAHAIYQSRKFC